MFVRPNSRSPAPHSQSPGTGEPALGHTPSLKYQPLTKADRKTDEQLQEMVRYRERKGVPHPDLPSQAAGKREMTGDEAAATRLFYERYIMAELEANQKGTRGDFDRHEYCQTYRREGDDIVANQDGFIVGGFNYVAPQSGRFPPGTRVDIHSHPNMAHPANAMPSDLDQRVAHQLRTNALHRPGTRMSGAIMYYPPTGKFFGYSGELVGFRKRPEFHELVDNFPSDPHSAPDYARSRLRVPDAPPRRYIAYHPDFHRRIDSPSTSTPVPGSPTRPASLSAEPAPQSNPPSRPIPIPGARSRPTSLDGSPQGQYGFSGSPSRFTPYHGSPSSPPAPIPPFAPSSLSPRMLPSDARAPFNSYTPPGLHLRQDADVGSSWQRRAVSADSRVPAADKPVSPAGTGIVLQPKPRRAADIKAMPPLPQWEALTGAIEDLSLDDERGRPGFGEAPGNIVRRSRVTQRSQEGSRGPRQASAQRNPAASPLSAPQDMNAPASLHPDGNRRLPNPWRDPDQP